MKTSKIIIVLVFILPHIFPINAKAAISYDEIEGLLREGRFEEAEVLLTDEAKKNDKDATVVALLGELYREKGDLNKAVKFLNKAISLNPEYPTPYFYRGKAFFSMQKFDEAGADFDLFIKKMQPILGKTEEKKYYIDRLNDISHIYFGFKLYEEARRTIEETLRVDPKDQAALYNMGIYYYTYERKRSTAYQYFSKAVEIDPSTNTATKARYAIEFMRTNPDPRIEPDLGFLDRDDSIG